jgi:hypothetical protein
VAWRLLTGSEFEKLRECIYADEAEFLHFRQVLVNVVMATDIMDKYLNGMRRARWETAFSSTTTMKNRPLPFKQKAKGSTARQL